MKNKDLDNFFKSKSNSFNEMPSDDLWKKIQNNLSQEPKPQSNFKKNYFMASLPIIALFSATALILNINKNPEKIDKTTLSKDSIKKGETIVILDTNSKIKSSPDVSDLKNSTLNIDTLKSPKNEAKANSIAAKHLMNDTINETIIYTVTSNVQEKIFSINEVEVKPEFPDGINKLYTFIREKFRTPKNCTGGRITMSFVIEKDGSLSDIKTVKDIGFGAGEEAIRVLKENRKWIPGKHNGKIVRVQYTLPITVEAEEGSDKKLVLENENYVYNMTGINVKPEFIGGVEKLHAFIAKNYKIPKGCPGGIVYLTFIVEQNGSLSNIKYVRDVGFGSGKEAVRVLQECPNWLPGEQNGKKVRVLYSLPITLKDAERSDSKSIIAEEDEIIEADTSVHSLAGIEQKPEFIGGMEKLYAFIAKNYKTPVNCRNGKVYMTFIVEKDGSLSDIKCVRDVGFGSGKEAIRVLQECPNWIPGEQNGKKVRVLYSMPITIVKAEK